MDTNKEKSNVMEETIRDRMNREFEDAVKQNLEGTKQEYNELVNMGIMKQEKADAAVKKKEEEFERMDFAAKISFVLNNFYCWWPGGLYRTVKITELEGVEEKSEKLKQNKKIATDVDDAIQEAGYKNIAEKIARRDKDVDNESRLNALITVYLIMRDKGYQREELTG